MKKYNEELAKAIRLLALKAEQNALTVNEFGAQINSFTSKNEELFKFSSMELDFELKIIHEENE